MRVRPDKTGAQVMAMVIFVVAVDPDLHLLARCSAPLVQQSPFAAMRQR